MVVGCALVVFAVAFLSPVSYAGSDGLFNLVVSQAMLEHHTIRLDAYADGIIPQMERYPYDIVEHNGHIYQVYPLGTPLFSAPFVGVARLFGRDMAIVDHNYRLQNDLSALLCALIFLVLYRIGRHYLPPGASLLVALISVLGSALASSVGTALWSADWTALYISLGVLLLARYDTGRASAWDPYLLGLCLFAAYFCRPASAVFVVVALGYLWFTNRKEVVKVGLTALTLLLPLMGFSWLEFGRLLPDYYLDMPVQWLQGRNMDLRLLGAVSIVLVCGLVYLWITRPKHRAKLAVAGLLLLLLVVGINLLVPDALPLDVRPALEGTGARRSGIGPALYGILLSPGRGLLVFSPFLIAVLLGSLLFWKKLENRGLAAAVLVLIGLHLLGLAASRVWSGGHAFGPRLWAEVIPALVLLTALVWKAASTRAGPYWRGIGAGGYLVFGIVAVLINSYEGLWNFNTLRWNGEMAPDINRHREYLFDWQYPQFLATSQSLCDRNLEHMLGRLQRGSIDLAVYQIGDWITYTSGIDDMEATYPQQEVSPPQEPAVRNALFIGWLRPKDGFRWSACVSSRVVFELGEVMDTSPDLLLEIAAGSLGTQQVAVHLNGVRIGQASFSGPQAPPVTRTIRFDGSLLRQNGLNEVEFYMPQAASPDRRDDRTLGLALRALRLHTTK